MIARIDGQSLYPLCIFGDEGSETLLGMVTQDEFGLGVDPVNRRLIPIPGFLTIASGIPNLVRRWEMTLAAKLAGEPLDVLSPEAAKGWASRANFALAHRKFTARGAVLLSPNLDRREMSRTVVSQSAWQRTRSKLTKDTLPNKAASKVYLEVRHASKNPSPK